jgi:hypothetical protein
MAVVAPAPPQFVFLLNKRVSRQASCLDGWRPALFGAWGNIMGAFLFIRCRGIQTAVGYTESETLQNLRLFGIPLPNLMVPHIDSIGPRRASSI